MKNFNTLLSVFPGWIKVDYLLVALIGLIFLALSSYFLYKGPTLSDEVIYAIVARNIVERGTLNTNIYRADSVVIRGYPTQDHHMAGFPLTLAATFVLFGVKKAVAGLPGQMAYLLSGLVLYGIGKAWFKPAVGFWAAFLFYIYPVSFVSASLVMVESPLNLVAIIYLAFWLVSHREVPKLIHAGILAVLLVVAMLYRETFIFFLPPTLFVLAKTALTRKNYRPLLAFSLLFAILLAGFFWPLSQNRGYYHFPFNDALVAQDWSTKIEILKTGLLNNISLTARPVDGYYFSAWLNLAFGVITTVLALVFMRADQKALTLLFVYLFWAALIILIIVHTNILDWATPRHMATFLAPGLLLFVAALLKVKRRWIGYAGLAAMVIVIGLSTGLVTKDTVHYQKKTIIYQQTLSSMVTKYLKQYSPQTIMYNRAFQAGWDHFPTTIVMTIPSSYGEMQVLDERLPIDAIIVNNERDRDIILDAAATGLLKERYVSLFPYKVEGHYFLVQERLLLQATTPGQ